MAVTDYGVLFNGRRIVHPGAYDAIDGQGMVITSPGSLNLPIVIGEADAGKPGEIMWFSGADHARRYLKSGDLVDGCELMFSPSAEGGGGASVVGVIISNTNARATLTPAGLNGTLTAIEYGVGGNSIQTKMENGTITGTLKFTASRWDTNTVDVLDNLGAVIKIKYTGAQAYAGVVVTQGTGDQAGKAVTLQTKIGATSAGSTVDITVDLTDPQFSTIEQVVRYLSGFADYQVNYVNYTSASLPSNLLDAKTIEITNVDGYVTALQGDVEYQINNFSKLVNIELTDNPGAFTLQYMSGGSRGVSPASWTTYFDICKKQFSDMLVVLTGDTSIQAEASAHVQLMELRGQKQVLFTGGNKGETKDTVKRRAFLLNSSRVVTAYPGIYYKGLNETGQARLLPSYLTGAMLAGRACGVDPSEPITFDYFNLVGLEVDLVEGDPDVDDLLTSGVATLERSPEGIRLAQGITTYLNENNSLFRELSVRRGADQLSTQMVKVMKTKFVGQKALPATIASVTTVAIDVLEQAIRDGIITGYGAITVTFIDGAVNLDYQVAPTEPINFVLVTSHFVPSVIAA